MDTVIVPHTNLHSSIVKRTHRGAVAVVAIAVVAIAVVAAIAAAEVVSPVGLRLEDIV